MGKIDAPETCYFCKRPISMSRNDVGEVPIPFVKLAVLGGLGEFAHSGHPGVLDEAIRQGKEGTNAD